MSVISMFSQAAKHVLIYNLILMGVEVTVKVIREALKSTVMWKPGNHFSFFIETEKQTRS